jgi:hypothetical protein
MLRLLQHYSSAFITISSYNRAFRSSRKRPRLRSQGLPPRRVKSDSTDTQDLYPCLSHVGFTRTVLFCRPFSRDTFSVLPRNPVVRSATHKRLPTDGILRILLIQV